MYSITTQYQSSSASPRRLAPPGQAHKIRKAPVTSLGARGTLRDGRGPRPRRADIALDSPRAPHLANAARRRRRSLLCSATRAPTSFAAQIPPPGHHGLPLRRSAVSWRGAATLRRAQRARPCSTAIDGDATRQALLGPLSIPYRPSFSAIAVSYVSVSDFSDFSVSDVSVSDFSARLDYIDYMISSQFSESTSFLPEARKTCRRLRVLHDPQ